MKVYVSYDQSVIFGTNVVDFPGAGAAGEFSAAFVAPSWGKKYDLLSLDSDGDLNITAGTPSWSNPVRPPCPPGEVPICYVFLKSTTTEITTGSIVDVRPFFSIGEVYTPATVSDTGKHVHAINEDKTGECNGAKLIFQTANAWEPESLQVFYNGHLLRLGVDIAEGEFRDEFEWLDAGSPPGVTDTLTVAYLSEVV